MKAPLSPTRYLQQGDALDILGVFRPLEYNVQNPDADHVTDCVEMRQLPPSKFLLLLLRRI